MSALPISRRPFVHILLNLAWAASAALAISIVAAIVLLGVAP